MVDLPLWKNMTSSVGIAIPNIWKIKKAMFQTTDQVINRIIHSINGAISIYLKLVKGRVSEFFVELSHGSIQTMIETQHFSWWNSEEKTMGCKVLPWNDS